MQMKKYGRIAEIGLWVLLLSATITNAVDVLSLLFSGSIVPEIRSTIQIVTISITAIMLLYMMQTQWKLIITSLLLFAFIWYRSAVYNSDATPFIEDNINAFFFESLPYLWVFNYFIKIDIHNQRYSFFNLLYKVCRVKLIIALITQLIMFIVPSTDIFHDYMNAANAMLLGLLVVTAKNITDHHRIAVNTFLEFATVLSIFILGSRGGLLCYASFYLFYFLFFSGTKKKILLAVLGITAFLLIVTIGPSLLSLFAGSDNRLLSLLSSHELAADESRALISGIVISNIIQHPWGMGVMADRAILSSSDEIWGIFYAHNLELEMGLNFGYIGLFASIVLLIMIIYYARSSYCKELRLLFLALVSTSIIKLQVSTSYWIDPIFWAVLGVLLAMYSNYKMIMQK